MVGLLLLVSINDRRHAELRDGGPVWSDPVAATKQEGACHAITLASRLRPGQSKLSTLWTGTAGCAVRRSVTLWRWVSRWHGYYTTTDTGRYSAARVITGIGGLFALIEVVYILLVLFGANAGQCVLQVHPVHRCPR